MKLFAQAQLRNCPLHLRINAVPQCVAYLANNHSMTIRVLYKLVQQFYTDIA